MGGAGTEEEEEAAVVVDVEGGTEFEEVGGRVSERTNLLSTGRRTLEDL